MQVIQRFMGKGKPIVWTEPQLDALSQVSQADIDAAAAMWRDRAPKPLEDLLDAEAEDVGI